MKRKKEWFVNYEKAHLALWWIPEGELPSLKESIKKLKLFQEYGSSPNAFTFAKIFPKE